MKKPSNFPCEKPTCMVVMSMKASNKIFTFIASCSVVRALGLLQYGHIMNMFQIIGNLNLLYPHIHCMIWKKNNLNAWLLCSWTPLKCMAIRRTGPKAVPIWLLVKCPKTVPIWLIHVVKCPKAVPIWFLVKCVIDLRTSSLLQYTSWFEKI